MRFREFLLNEDRAYLGIKVGDILTALGDLNQHGKSMGTRQLVANAEMVVNQIRRILHSNWKKEDMKYLSALQKAGVAIAKAIEEKDDLASILQGAEQELQKLSGDLGTPANNLATPEAPKPEPETIAPPQAAGPARPPQKQQNQPQQPPAQDGQPADQQAPADPQQPVSQNA